MAALRIASGLLLAATAVGERNDAMHLMQYNAESNLAAEDDRCRAWCTNDSKKTWEEKCGYRACKGCEDCKQQSDSPFPHVVVLMADDLGTGDLSPWAGENTDIKTPWLEGLVANGVALDRYYTQATCTPTRAALMTGRYPLRYGLQSMVVFPLKAFGVDLKERLMSNVFKDAGYSTHMIGKWHLGFHDWTFSPTFRGFDTSFFISHGEHSHTNFTWRYPGIGNFGDLFRQSRPDCGGACTELLSYGLEKTNPHMGYSTMNWTNEAVGIIHAHDPQQPLFIFLAYTVTHAPCEQPPVEYRGDQSAIEDSQRKLFAEMAGSIDVSIGKIVTALKEKDMFDNTIIVFTNDNGGPIAAPEEPTDGLLYYICYPWGNWGQDSGSTNYPLRGGKQAAYEGGVRGVSMIHWPAGLTGGRRFSGLAHVADWLPTLASATGVPLGATQPLDGIDLWHALKTGEGHPRTEVMPYIDGRGGGEGGVLIRNFTKIFVGGPFKRGFLQMPPELGKKKGLTEEQAFEEPDDFHCPDGCVVDLLEDPRERGPPKPLGAEHASLKQAFDDLKNAAVPNLWDQYPMDQAALDDLLEKGYSWPWEAPDSKPELRRIKSHKDAARILSQLEGADLSMWG